MIKNFRLFIFCLYLLSILILVSIVTVSFIYDIPISKFTRDQAVVLHGTPFHGILSNIGVLFWSWTAAISLFCYVLLRKSGDKSELTKFVLTGGLLTSMLLLDDFFMFHDWIFPRFGVNEKIVFLFYAVFILVYLIKFKQFILTRDYSLLLTAIFFFALSIIVDTFPYSLLGMWHHLFEDSTKFLGIVSWFGYHVSLYYQEISSIISKKDINQMALKAFQKPLTPSSRKRKAEFNPLIQHT